jgi:hypothetical protein
MYDAPSILPADCKSRPYWLAIASPADKARFPVGVPDDDLPVPGDTEILGAHESRYLDYFFTHRDVNGHGVSLSEEGLGGVYTPNWLMPPSVVGHNVSYGGYWDEGMLASMFGNEIQRQSPAAAPSAYGFQPDLPAATSLTFGYPAQPPIATPSSVLRRQPRTAAPSNLMTPQSQQSLDTQQSYADHQPTDDVLAAASVLSHGNGAHFDMLYRQRQQSHTPAPHASISGHYPSATSSTAHANQNPPAVLDGMVYRNPQTGEQPYTRLPRPPLSEVQFGSDPNFGSENFVSQSARETTQAMAEKQMATLLCLERNESAAPTRAASPSAWAPMSPSTATRSSMISPLQLRTASHNPPTPDEPPSSEHGPPTKRRRSSRPVEDSRGEPSPLTRSLPPIDDESHAQPPPGGISEYKRGKRLQPLTPEAETATTATANKKQRKPSQTNAAKTNGTSNPSSSRRKSSQTKPPREPLNEDQKRENHIRSEQKRRGVISRGYDILEELVPVLRGGKTHKANALQRAADFIEALVAGNERLKELLAEAGLEGDAIGDGHASAP